MQSNGNWTFLNGEKADRETVKRYDKNRWFRKSEDLDLAIDAMISFL